MLRCAARRRRRRAFSDSATRRQDTAASMAYQFSRKGCFKCGNRKSSASNLDCASGAQIPPSPVGHIAENCSSEQRLCYNCRQPGHESSACPSPRTVASKQCYSCGGVGHIQGMSPFRDRRIGLIVSGQLNVRPFACSSRARTPSAMYVLSSCGGTGIDVAAELCSLWTLRSQLPERRCRRLRLSRAAPGPRFEHVCPAPCQVLSLRWSEPYGEVRSFPLVPMNASLSLSAGTALPQPVPLLRLRPLVLP